MYACHAGDREFETIAPHSGVIFNDSFAFAAATIQNLNTASSYQLNKKILY